MSRLDRIFIIVPQDFNEGIVFFDKDTKVNIEVVIHEEKNRVRKVFGKNSIFYGKIEIMKVNLILKVKNVFKKKEEEILVYS